MALEYFLYTTEFNNTLIDRSLDTFAPLPPNTGQIQINFNIPINQPLYLFREDTGAIVENDQATIDAYLGSTVNTDPDDPADITNSEYTGFTATTTNDIDNLKAVSGFSGAYAVARTAANGTSISSFRLSVNRTGVGVYVYTFDTPLGDTNYIIQGQPYETTTDTNAQISNVTVNGFTLSTGVGDNGTGNDVLTDTEHAVGVYGVPVSGNTIPAIGVDTFSGYTGTTDTRISNIESDVTFISGVTDLKTDNSVFNQFTGDTINDINFISGVTDQKLDISAFNVYSGVTDNRISDNDDDITFISGVTDTKTDNSDFVQFTGDTITLFTGVNNAITALDDRLTGYTATTRNAKCQLIDTAGGQALNNVTPNELTWATQNIIDTNFFSHTPGTSEVTINVTGRYEISYKIVGDKDTTNTRANIGVSYRLNGSGFLAGTATASYLRNNNNDFGSNSLPPIIFDLTASDTLAVVAFRLGDAAGVTSVANESLLIISYLG